MTTRPPTEAPDAMSIPSRAFYAFAVCTTVIGVLAVADVLFRFGIGSIIFSPYLVVPMFVVAYFITPHAARRLKLGGWPK